MEQHKTFLPSMIEEEVYKGVLNDEDEKGKKIQSRFGTPDFTSITKLHLGKNSRHLEENNSN